MASYAHAFGPVAILFDGAFFLERYKRLYRDLWKQRSARDCVSTMYQRAEWHADGCELYRIFFYDCAPLSIVTVNPISKEKHDLQNSTQAKFRNELHEELRAQRKVALRMGRLQDLRRWELTEGATKDILGGRRSMANLEPNGIRYDVIQKGVDMRIGLDIASLSFKRQVKRIVLISGDSDFVPAAKLARREGVDFILDSMGQKIKGELFEHIDGLCCAPR